MYRALFWIGLVNLVAVGAESPPVTCHLNAITKDLCVSLDKIKPCMEGSNDCEGHGFIPQTMASTLFYLGRIDSAVVTLKSLDLYQGEPKARAREFGKAHKSGNTFFGLSYENNFIIFIDELNRRVREVATKLAEL